MSDSDKSEELDPIDARLSICKLMELAFMLGPTYAKNGFSDMLKQMQRDDVPDREVIINLASWILEGMRNGNWPLSLTDVQMIRDTQYSGLGEKPAP